MKRWRLEYPVQVMARVLGVSRSGFYAWLSRPPAKRACEDERLKVAVRAADRKTRGTYGAKRLHWELKAEGFKAGRDRITRRHRERGIICKQKRRFKATTSSNHALPAAENRLDQQFEARAPNEVGHTDISVPQQAA
jgi:putative transposase